MTAPGTPAPPSGLRLWVAGARPRTLGASIAPVLVGTGVAAHQGSVVPWRAAAALVVAMALQVGVNYANDHADGVRGVDRERRGPLRLTASGLASPAAVQRAAVASLVVASAAGIVLALAVDWRLLVLGAACVLAALAYSGGPRPYASAGLGEVAVLVFFGLVATAGSAFVHLERVTLLAVLASVPVGLGAVAILLVNNLRDVDSDRTAGKRTLAVRVGAPATRGLYMGCLAGAVLAVALVAAASTPWAVAGAAAAPLAVAPAAVARDPAATAPALVRALVATARFQLVMAVLLAAGLWLG